MRTARSVQRALTGFAVLASMTASTRIAGAQAPRRDAVAAEALFEEGRKLAAAGSWADACPKFADSQRLDPSPATLLNLANCWEKVGRSASAWATYREAASAANAAGRADYLTAAQRHADALAPRLAHLTINVAQPVDGIQVQRDGVIVAPAEWSAALPIDTGSHALAATAPGHKAWSATVDVAADGVAIVETVPALDAAPVEAPSVAPAAPPAVVTPAPSASAALVGPSSEPPPAPQRGTSQRIAGWIVAGAGVVGLGVAAGFTGAALHEKSDSSSGCNGSTCTNQSAFNTRNTAYDDGNVASWALGLGAAAVVGGVILVLTAPHGPTNAAVATHGSGATLVVAPTIGGALLRGTW